MLTELNKVRQIRDEPTRRWFADETMDLVVWLDDEKKIIGFQLSYDKPHAEHALTWKEDAGFLHTAVENGEQTPGKHKSTPILVPDGTFQFAEIAKRFRNRASGDCCFAYPSDRTPDGFPGVGLWGVLALGWFSDRKPQRAVC